MPQNLQINYASNSCLKNYSVKSPHKFRGKAVNYCQTKLNLPKIKGD